MLYCILNCSKLLQIFKFSRTPYLFRRQVISSTQLPPDEALEVLQSVACLNSEKKWQLLLPPDKEFEQRHSDLVQRQEMVWRANEQIFNDMDCERSPKRVRKRSVRDSGKTSQSSATSQPMDIDAVDSKS